MPDGTGFREILERTFVIDTERANARREDRDSTLLQ